MGGAVRQLARRPPDPSADRRLGRALVVAVLVPAGLPLPVAVAMGVALWCRPVLAARRHRRRREQALVDDLPDAVDLLRLAIQSGGNARLAVTAVAVRLEGEVGDHLRSVCRRVAHGERLADAVAVLRAVEPLRPVADAVIDAERYGVALGPSLDRLAAEARSQRRRQAEERARRVPVAMLFPLVGCVLPSFALLTVVPLFAGTLRTLHL
ncbi:MAG: type II secretion system F family protein [Acidimicrobiales bacterium]